MSLVNLIGLTLNDPVPGTYLQISFAQGPAAAGVSNYSVILIGNRLSSGAAQDDGYVYGPDTVVPMVSEADAISLFGAGSELHRMYRRFTAVNQSTSLYAVVVKESTGAQATGTITFTTTAASAGTARLTICDSVIDTGIASGDTVATIATNVIVNVNANVNLPVIASSGGSGVVTLTAKQKGLRGNFLRYSAQILPSSGVSTTVSPTNRTAMTGGTVADSNVNALATIANSRYYYQVSAAEDATQLGNLSTQLDSNAAPLVGLRDRGVAGSVDTVANVISLATGLNQARMEVCHEQNSDWTPAELAANNAAVYSLFESSLGAQSSLNFDSFGGDAVTAQFWKVPAPLDGTSPSRSQIKSLLLNGITPITSVGHGKTHLVRRITTRSLTNGQPDYRVSDSCIVTVCDHYGDDVVSRASTQFNGKVIANDPLPGQRIPGPQVVTPRIFLAMVNGLTVEYGNNDLLEDVQAIQDATIVVRESTPSSRMSARIPLKVISLFHQAAVEIDQV